MAPLKEQIKDAEGIDSPVIAETVASAPTPVLPIMTPEPASDSSPEGGARLSCSSGGSSGIILPAIKNRRSVHDMGTSFSKALASRQTDIKETKTAAAPAVANGSRFVFDGFMVGTAPGADVFQTTSAGSSSSAHVATTSATGVATHVGATAATVLQTTDRALSGLTLVDRVHTPVPAATETPQQSTRHMDGDVDAQEKYNASSCVFVANLPESQEDLTLKREIQRAFSQFGLLFVKIKRDMNNMPFAFCQYTNDEDAARGLRDGKGIVIRGRPVRTEKVRANRFFMISRRSGSLITLEEAEEQMMPHGDISSTELLSAQMQERLNMGPAVIVEFTRWNPNRDMNRAFRNDPIFRVDVYDPHRRRLGNTRSDQRIAALEQYNVTRRSVYVGNIPHGTSEADLRQFFRRVGEILSVKIPEVEEKKNRAGGAPRAYAFVEYETVDLVDAAIETLNGRMFNGMKVLVERKKDKNDRNAARRHVSMVDLRTGGATARSSALSREIAEQNVQSADAMMQSTPAHTGNVGILPQTPYEDMSAAGVQTAHGHMTAPPAPPGFGGMHPGYVQTPFGPFVSPYGGMPGYMPAAPVAMTPQHPTPGMQTPGMISPHYVYGPAPGHPNLPMAYYPDGQNHQYGAPGGYGRARVVTTPSRMPHAYMSATPTDAQHQSGAPVQHVPHGYMVAAPPDAHAQAGAVSQHIQYPAYHHEQENEESEQHAARDARHR